MAIDKITPRFLVSDEDERLLEAGAMTDALNVTISEDGEGSEGVIKNVKGTIAGTAVSGSALTAANNVTVIGQVSDPQRGKIYFFVADNDGSSEDAIYQYDVSSDTYKIVLKSSQFNFDYSGFVKADVVNGDFQQNGNIQTIIYFTDNVNPPRKINVERAIAGEYDSDLRTFNYSLTAVRASLNSCPTVRFETDSSIPANELLNDYFQFATQLIYKDGEESAISPYSELAVPSAVFQNTAESGARDRIFENVCVINPQYSYALGPSNVNGFNLDNLRIQPYIGIPDVESIRLLAKRGNNGSFFIIDDLPVGSSKTRDVLGESTLVWNHTTGDYRFYNDVVKVFTSSNLVDKMYDNVPKKALGQAVAGNRLFYSNYTEGYPNGGLNGEQVKAKFSQKFYPAGSDVGLGGQGKIVDEGGTTSNGDIIVNLANQVSWDNGSAATNVVDGGTKINIDFNYSPEGSVKGTTTSGISSVRLWDVNNDPFIVGLCPSDESAELAIGDSGTNGQVDLQIPINLTYTVPEDQTLADVTNALQGVFQGIERTVEYDYAINASSIGLFYVTDEMDSLVDNGDIVAFTHAKIKITYGFDDVVTGSTTDVSFIIKPYIKKISFTNLLLFGVSTTYYPDVPEIGPIVDEYQIMNVGSDPLSQNDQTFSITNTTAYIQNLDIFVSTTSSFSTFKAGCTHDFGIVYYDKWNRSGFVNEIGSVYVKSPSQRATGQEGRCEITISMDSEPPAWAAKWQVVYGGMSSFSDYFQYTTGPAFVTRNADHTIDTSSKRLYLSLKTLDIYTKEKSSLRNYSFTPGDILRVISYVDDSGATIYPTSNDPNKPIEFKVVDSVILDTDATDNPINMNTGVVEMETGTFLILDAPEVHSGVTITDSSGTQAGLKYAGFDWHSVAEAYGGNQITAPYPDGVQVSGANYWGQRTVVEVLSPSKASESKVYYETGKPRSIYTVGDTGIREALWSNAHGPAVTTRNGDTWLRLVSCKTPRLRTPGTNNWQSTTVDATGDGAVHDLDNWDYLDLSIENLQVDDFEYTKEWHKGRPHVPYKSAAEIRRSNGLTYGDAYAEDVANLSLTSFNPSLGNFDSLESKFGSVNYIGNYSDNLAAIQENKLSLVPVGKNIIQYAEGSGNVAISTSVIGQPRYASGDYGCGGHPEAVLIQDNDIFFVDESRQGVIRLGGDQLTPISDKGMSSAFEDFFKNGHTKYVSGYDPRINTYFITGRGGTDEETIGYDVNRKVWQSKYSFVPDIYANQDNMLYSALYNTNGNAFYRHDDNAAPPTNRNMFYEASTAADSMVEVVSKVSPSRVKVYNALSYEGDSALWDMNTGVKTDLGQTSGTITSWSKKEGSYYSAMPRAINGTSQYLFIGVAGAVSSSSAVIPLASSVRINRLPANVIGLPVYYKDASGAFTIEGLGARTLSAYTSTSLTLIFAPSAGDATDKELYVEIPDSGDPMRGHWAKIKLTNSSNTKHELYCINTHVTDSKSHHPLGQQ
jgi:hypothetical protein